jgi:phosphatidylinositol alpha-1,6-mannosyltransferase
VSESRVLVVTNDFPPRIGGIENFVWSLCRSLEPSDVVVYASTTASSDSFDARAPFPVVRDPSTVLLPTPAVARRVGRVLRAHECDTVVFGAAAPLGLLARGLRRAGADRTIAATHGHETWWARTPGARRLLRRIGDDNDVLTYVSEYCREQVAHALTPAAAERMQRLSPGVDLDRFRPGLDGSSWRRRWGIGPDQRVVLSASRLARRKGHDVLLDAWGAVSTACPDAVLVIAGDGPMRRTLERKARRLRLRGTVRVVPGAPWAEMPARYAAADVFAMPCRTRRGGLEPEALGIAFLEASACGLPIVVGRSGGAPETAVDGSSGLVVDPHDPHEVAAALRQLLGDAEGSRAMGACGRCFIAEKYGSAPMAARFRELVRGEGETASREM